MSALCALRSGFYFFKKERISAILLRRKVSDNKIRDAEVTESSEKDGKKTRAKIDVDTGIRYMKSKAYKLTYGDRPVWEIYVRNYKGQYPPATRQSCLHGDKIATGSPCPICRDEYLVVDYRNIDLIKQFVSSYGENILDSIKTGVCQKQHRNLIVAITKARNYGFLTFDVPHRHYEYHFYAKKQF